MTRVVVVIALLLLPAACSSENTCRRWGDEHQRIVDEWMRRTPTTLEEYRQEVEVLLPDQSCAGITPATLRKVILDGQRMRDK
jgi:hypothetical protein